jgi:nitronate monooxygenase
VNPIGTPAIGTPATGHPAPGARATRTPTPPTGASPARFRTRITELFGIEHPIGVNLSISRRPGFNRDVPAWIDIALDEGVRLFESAGSAPDEIVEPIHRGGGLLLHKCPSVRHAVTAQRLGVEAAGAHALAGGCKGRYLKFASRWWSAGEDLDRRSR